VRAREGGRATRELQGEASEGGPDPSRPGLLVAEWRRWRSLSCRHAFWVLSERTPMPPCSLER
jgi:hypothetical protein